MLLKNYLTPLLLASAIFFSIPLAWSDSDRPDDDEEDTPRTAAEIRVDVRKAIKNRVVDSLNDLLMIRCLPDAVLEESQVSISQPVFDKIEECAEKIEAVWLSNRANLNKTLGVNALTPKAIKGIVNEFIDQYLPQDEGDPGDFIEDLS